MEKTAVDWGWANQLPALAIFEAAALSLGYELDTLPPVGRAWGDKPPIDHPLDHRERTILAFEHAKNGSLATKGTTSETGAQFDKSTELDAGQFWAVDLGVFRAFCDRMGWAVPAKFTPVGYDPESAIADSPSVAENQGINQSPADPERRLARLLLLGGSAKYHNCDWKFTGIKALVKTEKTEGRDRSDEKTIRGDLKLAVQAERDKEKAGPFDGLRRK